MADPSERRRIGKVLAGVVKEHGTNIDVDALADELAESLIPAHHLQRFALAIINSFKGPEAVLSPSPEPTSRTRPALGTVEPTPDEMRDTALDGVAAATGSRPRRSGRGNAQTYRVGDGPTIYLRTNKPNQLAGDHRVYWFGLYLQVWQDPNAFFVLQCGLDFTLVVPVGEWLPIRDDLGHASGGRQRQPHVHRDGATIELREAGGFTHDLTPWVNSWDLLATAQRNSTS
jgi:hypothetical protein